MDKEELSKFLKIYCDPMPLPCGGTAYFDESSGFSYRCDTCLTIVGSISQPQSCKDEAEKYETWERLGGKGWDYFEEVE